jgi:hypothetical protein
VNEERTVKTVHEPARRPRARAPVALAALLAAAPAAAQHAGDIGLAIAAGRIETREISAAGYGAPRRVFGGAFGDTGVPWFTGNPGFDAAAGTFAAGTRVGFRLAGPVLAWDGAGFVPTSPDGPLAGERLQVRFLTLSVTSGDGPVDGFTLAVQPDGGWHRHLSMTLLAAPGAAAPDAGVYLVPLEILSTDPAVAASDQAWLVLDGGAPAGDYAKAFAHAESAIDGDACAPDLNGDATVDGLDLGALLGAWGGAGDADINRDGTVDGLDLGVLLGSWGACP